MLLEAGEDEGPDELEDFADLFAERLEEHEELVEYVEYRFELDAEFLELFYENALLFLPPERAARAGGAGSTDEAILRPHRSENRLRPRLADRGVHPGADASTTRWG